MNPSPLGKYGPLVAAIASLGTLAAFGLAVLLNSPSKNDLQPFAFVALGIIFGGSTAINGWKPTTSALESRVSNVEANAATTVADAAKAAAVVVASTPKS